MSVLSAGFPVAVERLTYATYSRPWYGLNDPSVLSDAMTAAGPMPRSGDEFGLSGNADGGPAPRTVVDATTTGPLNAVPSPKFSAHESRCPTLPWLMSVMISCHVPVRPLASSRPLNTSSVPVSGRNEPMN